MAILMIKKRSIEVVDKCSDDRNIRSGNMRDVNTDVKVCYEQWLYFGWCFWRILK